MITNTVTMPPTKTTPIRRMNSAQQVIGLMSGTSGDGIDVALVHTDGEMLQRTSAALVVPFSPLTQQAVTDAIQHYAGVRPGTAARERLDALIAEDYVRAVEMLVSQFSLSKNAITLAGFHGQTLYHDPNNGITDQAGDAALFAAATGIDTVHSVRKADMQAGGQGAPLAPVYHRALLAALDIAEPAGFLNVGGVCNITFAAGEHLVGFDCGPGNALMDDYLCRVTGQPFDDQGQVAASGEVDQQLLQCLTTDSFFNRPAPKSLDRQHFRMSVNECLGSDAGAESTRRIQNVMATLCELTVFGVVSATRLSPEPLASLVVAGGGRHNAHLLSRLRALLPGTAILTADAVGLPGDVIEAELMAYLAARHVAKLPTSFPSTTGCTRAVSGGELIRASEVA